MHQLAQQNLADDDGSQTDDDGASAHVHIGSALILGKQRPRQGNQAVAEHQADGNGDTGIHALGAGHPPVCTGGPKGAAVLRTEEPVENGNEHHQGDNGGHQRIAQGQLSGKPLGYDQIVLIHGNRLIRLAAHNPQIHGVQSQLGQDAAEDGRNAAAGVQQAGSHTGKQTHQEGAHQRQPGITAGAHEHHAHRAAGGQAAVYRQVSHVQDAVGDIYADGHDAPEESLGNGAGRSIQKGGKKSHIEYLIFLFWNGDRVFPETYNSCGRKTAHSQGILCERAGYSITT